MRKYLGLILLTMTISGVLAGPGEGVADGGLLPTSLKITVIDNLGNVVVGATVTLYASKDDYLSETNPLFSSEYTDKKGQVVFKKLKPRPYYIHAIKGEKSNNGEGVRTDKLKEGRINKVNTVIW